jgi:hypothetical protein
MDKGPECVSRHRQALGMICRDSSQRGDSRAVGFATWRPPPR